MKRFQRGFASLLAVALLGLVAVTAVALFALASADYRRTQYNEQASQLRQMLLAGAAQVVSESKDWPATPNVAAHQIALPNELTREGGEMTLTVTPHKDETCEAHLVATLGRHHASQVLTLEHQNEKWKVIRAQLEG